MKKSIVISFTKNSLFPQSIPMHSVFTLRETATGNQLSGILELHYIELGKIHFTNSSPEDLTPLEQLGAYIKYSGDYAKSAFVEALVQKGKTVISMTDTVLRKVSEEERLQYLRESREKAELDILLEKTFAREEGRAHAILEIAKNFKEDGIPTAIIAKNTGLTEKEIDNL